MKKEYIIFIGAGLLMAIVIGSGYQFYLKPKGAELEAIRQEYLRYDAKLTELEERYSGYVPEDVVKAWSLQLTPWYRTIESRGELFGLGRVEYEPVPDNTLPKFHYSEQYNAMIEELRAEALEKNITLPNVNFNVPSGEVENVRMSKELVEENLETLALECNLVRMVLESNPVEVNSIVLWPERNLGRITAVSVGYSCTIRMKDLAQFIDDLTTRRRYASIDYINITNDNLLEGADPRLQTSMVITQAAYEPLESADPESIMEKASQETDRRSQFLEMMKNRPLRDDDDDMRRKPPTWWQRFRKRYLPF